MIEQSQKHAGKQLKKLIKSFEKDTSHSGALELVADALDVRVNTVYNLCNAEKFDRRTLYALYLIFAVEPSYFGSDLNISQMLLKHNPKLYKRLLDDDENIDKKKEELKSLLADIDKVSDLSKVIVKATNDVTDVTSKYSRKDLEV